MPADALYVGRPSMDGNPYRVGDGITAKDAFDFYCQDMEAAIATDPQAAELMRKRLRGRDLVCWCALDQPCHADWLLEFANH